MQKLITCLIFLSFIVTSKAQVIDNTIEQQFYSLMRMPVPNIHKVRAAAEVYFAGKENRYPPAVKYIVILLILTLISVTLWSNWDMKRRFAALHKQGSKSETKEINR